MLQFDVKKNTILCFLQEETLHQCFFIKRSLYLELTLGDIFFEQEVSQSILDSIFFFNFAYVRWFHSSEECKGSGCGQLLQTFQCIARITIMNIAYKAFTAIIQIVLPTPSFKALCHPSLFKLIFCLGSSLGTCYRHFSPHNTVEDEMKSNLKHRLQFVCRQWWNDISMVKNNFV